MLDAILGTLGLGQIIELFAKLPIGLQIVSVLGTLDVVGTAIIKMTSTVKDDEWLAKIQEHKTWGPVLKTIEKFSYFDLLKKK